MKLKMMQLHSNWSQSQKPNWVAPFSGCMFLKEMKLKMMQLNSKWSQSKNQIELHLFWVEVFLNKWNWKWCNLIQSGLSLKTKLSYIFFRLHVSKRNEFEKGATQFGFWDWDQFELSCIIFNFISLRKLQPKKGATQFGF